MKQFIKVLFVGIVLMFNVCSCCEEAAESTHDKDMLVSLGYSSRHEILMDNETKVMYMENIVGDLHAPVVMVDADGKPRIYDGEPIDKDMLVRVGYSSRHEILVDKETKVMYMENIVGHAYIPVVMVDADGKPRIYERNLY